MGEAQKSGSSESTRERTGPMLAVERVTEFRQQNILTSLAAEEGRRLRFCSTEMSRT